MPGKLKLIIVGDIVAKIGRKVVKNVLPKWQKKYKPHGIIANVENLAHGKGLTTKSINDIRELGICAGTGGNHTWSKDDPASEEIQGLLPVVLPANDPRTTAPKPWKVVTLGKEKVFVLNLLGQFLMNDEGIGNAFTTFDKLYQAMGKPKLLIVDLHAEATSEKVAFGHYVDGRASIVCGTHTHIPTADARILSSGTGYITDVGMTGSNDSVLGVNKETIVRRFLTEEKEPFDYPESGPAWINALYAEFDTKTGHCVKIKQLQKTITIK